MKLAGRYRDLPIRHKLRLIVMLTVGAALAVACGAVLMSHYYMQRDSLRRDLSVLAEITGDNSTAALSFGDRKTAEELLSGLRAKRSIATAAIYSADGKVFASYRRGPAAAAPASLQIHGTGWSFENNRLRHRSADPAPEAADRRHLSGIGLGRSGFQTARVLAHRDRHPDGGAAAGDSYFPPSSKPSSPSRSPGWRARPRPSRVQKDFTVRAAKTANDDLGQLTDAFNGMLAEIQQRDRELLGHRDRLEQEVTARTAELVAANSALSAAKEKAEAAQPRQERIPGQYEPRNPNADERRHRDDRTGAGHQPHRRAAGLSGHRARARRNRC